MNITAPKLALVYHVHNELPTLAAIVATDSLEVAFESTNTIDRPWQSNANVISTGVSMRSTSVGDYVQMGINIWRCDPMGWTHVAPTKWQLIKSFFVGV